MAKKNKRVEEEQTALENSELAEFGSTGIFTEEEPASFLPEVSDEDLNVTEDLSEQISLEGTELDSFETAEIEDLEFLEEETLDSIIESVLFASDRPVSLNQLKMVFKGTNIRSDKIRRALDRLAVELAGARRGVSLEEVPGGYQLRTKVDNMKFLTRTLKARPFRLSGPALEVLAIVAYKQPLIKSEIDEIRGVESGHLLRALMEKGLVTFEGKSDLPGKPMQYGSTKKFLEIFGLRNIKELPTLSQIDELLPEGMTEEEAKPTLGQVADHLAQNFGNLSYSEGEEELEKITSQLTEISTSSDFFEQEKLRIKQKQDADRAQGLREALLMGEEVNARDRNWLTRYEEAQAAAATGATVAAVTEETATDGEAVEMSEGLSFDDDDNSEESSVDEDLAMDRRDDDDDESTGEASL
jgi:segregation and condensation protein B